MFVAGMRSVAETGTIPPEVGIWVPVLFLLVAGAYLFIRAASERTIEIFKWIPLLPGFRRKSARAEPGKPKWRWS
jgi:hypothetical protein